MIQALEREGGGGGGGRGWCPVCLMQMHKLTIHTGTSSKEVSNADLATALCALGFADSFFLLALASVLGANKRANMQNISKDGKFWG